MTATAPVRQTSTITETETTSDQTEPQALLLRLQQPGDRREVKWRDDTVDNEGMEKKKSKCCCVYRKPHKFGESSSSSSSSDSDSESDAEAVGPGGSSKPKSSHRCTEHCRGHGSSDYRRKKEKLRREAEQSGKAAESEAQKSNEVMGEPADCQA